MVEVDRHRIHRLQCPICGSRDKKIMRILQLKEPVGYATECCNCGHVNISANGIIGLSAIIGGGCTISAVECGIANPWCPSRNCPLFNDASPTIEKDKPPKFIYNNPTCEHRKFIHEKMDKNELRTKVYADRLTEIKQNKKYK